MCRLMAYVGQPQVGQQLLSQAPDSWWALWKECGTPSSQPSWCLIWADAAMQLMHMATICYVGVAHIASGHVDELVSRHGFAQTPYTLPHECVWWLTAHQAWSVALVTIMVYREHTNTRHTAIHVLQQPAQRMALPSSCYLCTASRCHL